VQRLKRITGVLLVFPLVMPGGGAEAHTGDALVPVRLVVAEWVNAYMSGDLQALSELLSEDFNGSPAARSAYLARVPLIPVKQVLLRYANFSIEGTTAQVDAVVHVPYRELRIPFSLSMILRKRGDAWRLTSISESDHLPEELARIRHPQRYRTYPVAVALRDATSGDAIHARVHVRDRSGEYWPPQGHRKIIAQGWREDIGGDVIVAGKTFAYVDPEFILPLPVGDYVMEVSRGPEYIPVRVEFEVVAGEQPRLQVELKRWVAMADRGWYSGDSHTHFLDPHTALQEARGEDLNVINVLSSSGGNLITQVHQFTGAPSVLSDKRHIVYISEETRHDYLGHTVLLNLKEHVFPFGWGGPLTGVHGGYDYPTMAEQADRAHAQEGALVAWSHLPHPHAELPIDVALGKIDAVETMVFGSPFELHPVRVRMDRYAPAALSPLELWYWLLNTGFDLPGLGATDKMWNSQVAGAVRTYVQLNGTLTYDRWIEGIRAGRTFFTSGPMLFLDVDGHAPGETIERSNGGAVSFRARLESWYPVERVELVMNGEVVASVDNAAGERELELSGHVTVEESSWLAARAYSGQTLPTQAQLTGRGSPLFAHTSPVYVSVDQQARSSAESAAELLKICDRTLQWAKHAARYHDDAQRERVLELYGRGRAVLQRQVMGR
jgi:hypothetical protein